MSATVEERINWLKSNLQSFDVFKQSNLSRQFKNRVVEFFDGGGVGECEARFFMTWIAPVAGARRRRDAVPLPPEPLPPYPLRAMDSEQVRLLLKPLADLRYRFMAAASDIPYLANGTPAAAWYAELLSGEVPGEVL